MPDDYQPDPDSVAAMGDLAAAAPAMAAQLAAHIAYHGEVLPHVVMSDFRDALMALVEADDKSAVDDFLTRIDHLAATGNASVRNVIAISFLEDGVLLSGGRELEIFQALVPRFGAATRALLDETEQHLRELERPSTERPA